MVYPYTYPTAVFTPGVYPRDRGTGRPRYLAQYLRERAEKNYLKQFKDVKFQRIIKRKFSFERKREI